MTTVQKNSLSTYQENLCEYGGGLGVLITLTVMIQHLVVTISHWLTYSMLVVYVFSMASFLLLAFKKVLAPYLIIPGAVFSLAIVIIWSRSYAFSLMVMVYSLYHLVMVVLLFAEELPAKLKDKAKEEKAEREAWAGKI